MAQRFGEQITEWARQEGLGVPDLEQDLLRVAPAHRVVLESPAWSPFVAQPRERREPARSWQVQLLGRELAGA